MLRVIDFGGLGCSGRGHQLGLAVSFDGVARTSAYLNPEYSAGVSL
jgi:hypothetical protein